MKDKFAYMRRDTIQSANFVTSGGQTSRSNQEEQLVDWRDLPDTERGELLYRQVFFVRCNLDNNEELKCNESVISLYLNNKTIQIEVILFKDPSQISIASTVPAADLFAGEDPMALPFKDRVTILNKMLEKFFIINESGICQMKVEVNEMPIQEYMAAKENEQKMMQKKDKSQ